MASMPWQPASPCFMTSCNPITGTFSFFTSNGDSCKALLKAIPQLQGLTVFTSDEEEGDVLVVGLNGA